MDIIGNNNVHNLIALESMDNLPYEIKDMLLVKLNEVASVFGFTYLINDLKIKLFICSKNDFEKKVKDVCKDNLEEVVAFQYNINSVCILDYQTLHTKYSLEEYTSVIIHECTHVLQFYYSRKIPNQYVWLYESVACFLSGQINKRKKISFESWDVFKSDFYNMKNCYDVAYRFGVALFQLNPIETMDIIKYPEKYDERLNDIYCNEMMKVFD